MRYDGTRENAISLSDMDHAEGIPDQLGAEEQGKYGGGLDTALKHWAIEGVLFMVLLGFAYGAIVGTLCRGVLNQATKRLFSFTLKISQYADDTLAGNGLIMRAICLLPLLWE